MAVKLISIGTSMNTNAGVYKADNISDMNSMSLDNIEFGSECLVIATGVRYILNSNGEWKKQPGIVIGSDLPEVDPSDEGKVLTVDNNGAWIAEDLPVELPTITGADEGKVLTIDDNGMWVAEDLPEELPVVSVSDKDKFLHTNSSTGELEWEAITIPTELPAVNSTDNGKILTVNEGNWDKVMPNGTRIITYKHTVTTVEEDTVFTCSLTGQEIKDAIDNCIPLCFNDIYVYEDDGITYHKKVSNLDSEVYYAIVDEKYNFLLSVHEGNSGLTATKIFEAENLTDYPVYVAGR